MTTLERRSFELMRDRDSGAVFEDVRLTNCTFDNCSLSTGVKTPERRTKVRNVEISTCVALNCFVGPAVCDNVTIDGLVTNQLLVCEGSLFRHVTFKGKSGSFKIIKRAGFVDIDAESQSVFDRDREAYYESVDWAVDISDAAFVEFDLHGIPANLIRRDSETQVIVRSERVLVDGWQKELASWNKYWISVIESRLRSAREGCDFVLVAPRANKQFRDRLKGIKDLRDAGIAEPD
jgi:hypothetical protein